MGAAGPSEVPSTALPKPFILNLWKHGREKNQTLPHFTQFLSFDPSLSHKAPSTLHNPLNLFPSNPKTISPLKGAWGQISWCITSGFVWWGQSRQRPHEMSPHHLPLITCSHPPHPHCFSAVSTLQGPSDTALHDRSLIARHRPEPPTHLHVGMQDLPPVCFETPCESSPGLGC